MIYLHQKCYIQIPTLLESAVFLNIQSMYIMYGTPCIHAIKIQKNAYHLVLSLVRRITGKSIFLLVSDESKNCSKVSWSVVIIFCFWSLVEVQYTF